MVLRAEGIARQYFRKTKDRNVFWAVQETHLELPEGQVTEIAGRSGSGKSTLLNMLAGLLAPTKGRVYFEGNDLYALGDEERSRLRSEKIGIIPQGQTGLHSLTVLENVLLPCRLHAGGAKRGAEALPGERAMELLRRTGIEALAGAYPRELSGGELRRMAIARALIREPRVLLADEPTGDLDDESTESVLRLLRETADSGCAVLLVTHEREAQRYADRVLRMNAGVLSAAQEMDLVT